MIIISLLNFSLHAVAETASPARIDIDVAVRELPYIFTAVALNM